MSDIALLPEVDAMDEVWPEIDLRYILTHQNGSTASVANTPEQWTEQTRWEEKVRHLENLNAECRYKEAVRFGREFRHEFVRASDVVRGEFLDPYAKALIYTGATERAIKVLEEVIAQLEYGHEPEDAASQDDENVEERQRRDLVLGLAHNHVGYAYWMNQGHYRLALREFCAASLQFAASRLQEECANTCDNIGRVLARLGQLDRAALCVEQGFDVRRDILLYEPYPDRELTDRDLGLEEKHKREYRVALSLISRAIVYLEFGKLGDAHRCIVKALHICERLGALRGIGLSLITLGRVLRQMAGSHPVDPYDKRVAWLDQAVMCLDRAVEIFGRDVTEPVRQIAAYNERGCVYRDRADLARRRWPRSELVRHYHDRAVKDHKEAIHLAVEHELDLLHGNACEDLAETYFRNEQLDEAERSLRRAEKVVPSEYKAKEGSELQDIPVERCVEEFWLLMSKIERLRGGLASARSLGDRRIGSDALRQATRRHYTWAENYRQHYLALEIATDAQGDATVCHGSESSHSLSSVVQSGAS